MGEIIKPQITPLRVLVVLFALLYGYLRFSAFSKEKSHLPDEMAHPIVHDGNALMTFQSGDEDGQPIIFVHRTPGAADNWAYFLHKPRPGFRVIAVDRPGFGETTPGSALPDLSDQAAALHPLLVSLSGRNPILVGHSFGAPVVCQAAVDYPDLVGGLVIVAGSVSPSVEVIYSIQYVGDLPGIRLLLPRSLRNFNHELIPLRHGLEGLAPRLAEITCPVIIIHGTEDRLVPFENVAFMTEHFREGVIRDTIVLEGENHFLPWTAQDEIWDAIDGTAFGR